MWRALRLGTLLGALYFALADCTSSSGAPDCTDANVEIIQASNYDQSCKSAADCVAVSEGNACFPCVIECPTAAITAGAKAKYMSDIEKTSGWQARASASCHCPASFTPCCLDGVCHADLQCSGSVIASAADASADAGTE
jgi:hypothetical protein